MNRLYAALIGLALVTPAFADSTINNLGAGAAVSGTDIFPAYQGANPATGVTAAQIKTFANGSAVDARTTTSEAIANSDQNKLVTFSNGSAVAATIAQAGAGGNFAAGWAASLKNLGAGTVTLTPTTSTIDGAATLVLTTGQGVDLYSDGTNYFTQPGKGSTSPGGTSGQLQTNNGSGGFGAVAAPSGAVVGTTDSQTLTNKSIAASEVNSGTLAAAQMPAYGGDCSSGAGTATVTCGSPSYFVSNNWLILKGPASAAAGNGLSTSTIYCHFGYEDHPVTVKAIGAHITTVGSSNAQFALYSVGTDGLPNALLDKTGNVADTSLGVASGALGGTVLFGPATTNGAGVYFCTNVNDGTVVFSSVNTADLSFGQYAGNATANNLWNTTASSTTAIGVFCAGANCTGGTSAFGTWPASLHGSTFSFIRVGVGAQAPIGHIQVN